MALSGKSEQLNGAGGHVKSNSTGKQMREDTHARKILFQTVYLNLKKELVDFVQVLLIPVQSFIVSYSRVTARTVRMLWIKGGSEISRSASKAFPKS